MKKYLRNDKGYSLLLSICVILIFSILGLSLMTLTSSGVAKNANREEIIQAQDLSDKGIEFAVGDIQKTLEEKIKATPMGKTEFGTYLDKTLNNSNLKCPDEGQPIPDNIGYKIPGENSSFTKVCIEKVDMIISASGITEEKDKYKRIVTFRSVGVVNSKEHVSKSEVIIGTDAIPDQLRYAISSNNNGSIYLYGGVDVTGDIKSAKDLIIHNQGYSLSGTTPNWSDTVYTRLKADSKSVTPKIILPDTGSLYINKNTSHLKSESNILNLDVTNHLRNYTGFTATNPALVTNLRSTLFDSTNVTAVTKSIDSDEVKIQEKVLNLYETGNYSKFYNNSLTINNSNKNSVNLSKDDIVLIRADKTCIRYNWWGSGCAEWREGGEFNIGANSVNLRGQYYVYGNLNIQNSSINSDAIIYVDGDVNITDSTLNGLGSNGTLIIFATGKIKIINISKYSDESSKIKGFFYSQDTLNMFGVFSNIQIQGGISANNVILSAVRGKFTSRGSTDSVPDQGKLIDHDRDPSTPLVPSKTSRLTIIYDQDLIDSYTSFKRDDEEEFITQLNDPETINRQ
ncbi:hypothetical protein [Solibacillus sp. CAU 1738]|uniref:hypothetical protein n=1 Tax=Solibacillus sp. CAU 1738 TaxID=3140363 RepID=UPI003261CF8C